MLKHVLVPLDGSQLAEQALSYAQDVVMVNGKITLLSVIELPSDYDYALVDIPLTIMQAGGRMDKDQYESAYERVQGYLEEKAVPLRKQGFKVECLVEAGVPADVIVKQAGNCKTTAIVMSTHGRTGLSRWLFGSVAQKVIGDMPCPVMVVPGTQPEEVPEEKSTNQRAYAT